MFVSVVAGACWLCAGIILNNSILISVVVVPVGWLLVVCCLLLERIEVTVMCFSAQHFSYRGGFPPIPFWIEVLGRSLHDSVPRCLTI